MLACDAGGWEAHFPPTSARFPKFARATAHPGRCELRKPIGHYEYPTITCESYESRNALCGSGFRMVGTFDNVGFKFGRWLDSVLMQRPLGPGATAMP